MTQADQLARALSDALEYIEDYKGEKQRAYAGYPKAWAAMDEFLQEAREALAAYRAQADKPAEAVAYYVPNARVCLDGSMEDGLGELVFSGDASDYAKKIGQPLYASPHQVAQPQWIPVSERLPEDGQLVFTAQRRAKSSSGYSYSICAWSEDIDSMFSARQFRKHSDLWMAIPAAPTKEQT